MIIGFAVSAQIEPVTKTDGFIINKQYLSIDDGIGAREVYCAVEDKDGFMWFGTSNGLCRYDGNSYKNFTKQNFGLLENQITTLSIDENNHLLIEFSNVYANMMKLGEVQVLDINNYTLKTIESTYPKMPFKKEDIVWITNDENKKLIFVTANPYKVWEYTSAKGFKLRGELTLWNDKKNSDQLNISNTTVFSTFQNGYILLKLNNFNYPNYLITADTLIPFSNKPDEYPFSITKNKSLLFYNNISGAVSKRSFTAGIDSFTNKNDETFLHLPFDVQYPWYFPRFHSEDLNVVYNLNKGLYLIDDKKLRLILKPEEIAKIKNFGIFSIFKDSRGNHWFCTQAGIIQVNITPNYFKSYFSIEQETRPDFNQVRGIYADNSVDVKSNKPTTNLYANVWQYLCIAKENSTKTILSSSQKKYAFNAILKHKDDFYIGTQNTIQKFIPNQNKTQVIGTISNDTIHYQYIWALTAVSDSIFLAGHTDGLSQLNILTQKSNALLYASSKIPKAKNVYRFIKTKSKGLVAVAENGLFVIDKNNMVVDYYGSLVSDASHLLPVTTIFDMHEDTKGVCWIASSGEGLFRWDWRNVNAGEPIRLKQFTIDQGLPAMILYRIEEDADNNLWIGSYNGLICFNTLSYSVSVYTTNDGLTHNEFNRTSSFKADDGTMYFGGMDGVNAFQPNQLISSRFTKAPFFALTSLMKYSGKEKKLVDGLFDFEENKKIVLNSNDPFLIIEFQLLDYLKRKHLYAYKLEGMDKDWIYTDQNSIRLAGLPYGEFKMHIKAQLADGKWSTYPIVFSIVVAKPFYLETWFFAVVLLLLILGIFLFLRVRNKQNQKAIFKLEKIVNTRTQELTKALQDKNILLAEVHHRTKNNLHIIKGLLRLQREQIADHKIKDVFSEGESRINSIALIHQHLYQKDNLGNVEWHSFSKDLCDKLAGLFENKNHEVNFKLANNKLFIDIDTAVPLGLIINELLTNSFKCFTNKKNTISMTVSKTGVGDYTLIYKDSGPGLKEGIDFYDSKTLGLQLIKGLAGQLHGEVTYEFQNGSEFTITFKDKESRYLS